MDQTMPLSGLPPVVLVLVLLLSRPSLAIPYPIDLRIDDESELDQAWLDGDLSEDQRDRLRLLLGRPIDLNTASRDVLYDLPGMTYAIADLIIAARSTIGLFSGVEDLAAVPGLPRDVYDQALPFIQASVQAKTRDWSAETTVGAAWKTEVQHPDGEMPELAFQGRVIFLRQGSAGFLVAVKPRIGQVNGAPRGESLSATPMAMRLNPGAIWLAWDAPGWSVIAGSYRIGFGCSLTISNSLVNRPHGWSVAGDASWDLNSGTVSPGKSFNGLVLRAKQINLPLGWLDISAFISAWPKDMSTNDFVYNRCPTGESKCSAPAPFLVDSRLPPDPQTGVHRSLYCDFPTLPNAMWEVIGGANIGWWYDDRNAVGATGYVSWLHLRPRATDLRLTAASPYPEDHTLFGAAGLDFRVGRGIFDLAGEATITGQSSPAAVLTARIAPVQNLEILPSFRYYSPGYDNPYARSDADADEFLGNRTRDELGGRLQLSWQPHQVVRLGAHVDVWHHRYPNTTCDPTVSDPDDLLACPTGDEVLPIRPTTNLETLVRIQLYPTRKEHLAVSATYNDRDILRSGRRLSYASYQNTQGDFSGGEKISWAISGSTTRIRRMSISFMVRQVFEDVHALTGKFDQSWYAWLRVAANLSPGPKLALRLKYLDESTVADPERSAGQVCDFETRGADLPARLPASCRGQTYVQASLLVLQRFAMGPGRWGLARVQAAWTRWLDHRGSWRYCASCDTGPSRDQVALQGSLAFHF
jgi:hypothetical protein